MIGVTIIKPEGIPSASRLDRFVGDQGYFKAQITDQFGSPVDLTGASVTTRTTRGGSALTDGSASIYAGVEDLGLVRAFFGTVDTQQQATVRMTFRVYRSDMGTVTYGPLPIRVQNR